MKECSKCKETKPTSEFHKDARHPTGYKCWCKACAKAKRNPEQLRLSSSKWYANHTDTFRSRARQRRYGITPDQYNQLLTEQQHCCAICQQPFTEHKRAVLTPCVDHCHASGAVRGILCSGCNRMLGLAKDNRDILLKAVDYLDKVG